MLNKLIAQLNDNETIQPISGMDAVFIYGETPTSHMHIGSVVIIDGALEFEDFKKTIASRIHFIPKLRKRLVEVPFSIDHPYWVDDPNFDLDMHLRHIALPLKGGWKELRETASQIFSEPLDHSKPLWSFTFVEGLTNIPEVPDGSVAIISKIHHVAIDGMAGADILSIMFDLTPDPPALKNPEPYEPAPIPNELMLMLKSGWSFAKKPLKFPRLLGQTLKASLKAGALSRVQKSSLPTGPFMAPNTPLNGIISARRKWNSAILSLDRVKVIKNIMGTTLNDIMLAICAGALRKYLFEKGKLPHKPLIAMVPVSIRNNNGDDDHGNNLSSMLIQLATNIEDPIERLEVIHENSSRSKTYHGAMGAKTLSNMAQVVPFGLANQAARLYSRFRIAEYHKPVFNLTITNVPGPPIPIYLYGHKVLSIMGMAPIIDGMGLIITIFSYNGLITVSPTSDVKSMPDMDTFTRYIRDSANELEDLILKKSKKRKSKTVQKQAPLKSTAVINSLKKFLKENPEAMRPDSGLFEIQVTTPSEAFWRIDLNKQPGIIRKGKVKDPDATFSISDQHLYKMAQGKLNVQTAMLQGRLKINGDLKKAMNIGHLFKKASKILELKNN